ncbi:hypothetical protein J6590_019875 [Homalodisca vitripennis]|nr:hypothetical protein J6590_019875 [Homalodisca vitripennis]
MELVPRNILASTSRPIVGRHTVKELQRSIQPASSDMSAPTPDRRGRTVTDMWSLNFDGHGAVYERHQSWI